MPETESTQPSEVAETTAGEREVKALLAGHEYTLGMLRGSICTCGHMPTVDAESLQTQQDYHRRHVAALLAALLDRVRREEGAKVLREAAAAWVPSAPNDPAGPWLRARAASVGRGEGL